MISLLFFPTNDRAADKVFPTNVEDCFLLFEKCQRELVTIISNCTNDNNDENYHLKAHLDLSKLSYVSTSSLKIKREPFLPEVMRSPIPCGQSCRATSYLVDVTCCNRVILIALSPLRDLCPDKSDKVLQGLRNFHCFCHLCVDCFCAATRSLTQFMKKCNTLILDDWQVLCHGENLSGYNLKWTKGSKDLAVLEWCSGSITTPTPDYGTKLFGCMVKLFPGSRSPSKLTCKTLSEYIQNSDEWLTTGSGSVRRRLVQMESGEFVRAKKNKTLWAMSQKDPTSLASELMRLSTPMPMHCADKVELGRKERLIIVAGEDCLILFGFIHYYISYIVRSLLTPLFFSSTHLPKFWFNLMTLCRNKQIVQFPYDAPSFDQKVSRLEWRMFFGWLYHVLNAWCDVGNKAHVLDVLNKCNELFFKLKVVLPESGAIVDWEKGIPSGIRFTALADTVINMARQQFVYERLIEDTSSFFFCRFFGLGDDILLFLPDQSFAELWFQKVNDLGFGANNLKNWTSKDCGEFLKRVIYKNTTRGYLLRRLGGHAFRDPTKSALPPGRERMEERLSSFLILNDRFCNSFDVFNQLCYSMQTVTFNKIKNSMASELVRTPRFAGGCGLTGWNEKIWLGWQTFGDYAPPAVKHLSGIFQHVDRSFKTLSGIDASSAAKKAVGQRIAASTFAPARLVKQTPFFVNGDVVDPFQAMFHARDIPNWSSRYPFPAYLTRYWFKSRLSQGDFDVCLSICSEHTRPIVEIMIRSWRRRDIYDWVDGKLELGSAVMLDCGSETVNFVCSYFRRIHFYRLLAYHRVDSKHIAHSAQVVERSVHMSLRRFRNRLVIGR